MKNGPRKAAGLLIIWEFRVRTNQRKRFEEVYGQDGVWAMFFRTGSGYIRTELLADPEDQQRYFTLDFWNSRRAYEAFRRRNRDTYKRIDKECESFTTSERLVGYFRLDKQS